MRSRRMDLAADLNNYRRTALRILRAEKFFSVLTKVAKRPRANASRGSLQSVGGVFPRFISLRRFQSLSEIRSALNIKLKHFIAQLIVAIDIFLQVVNVDYRLRLHDIASSIASLRGDMINVKRLQPC